MTKVARFAAWLGCVFVVCLAAEGDLRAQSNVTIRVIAANLTSGNNQRYETPGLNILKGLKPDIVAIQEFNYASATWGVNSPAAIREMVDGTFGPNFVYFRESGYSIPNGIISRYPVIAAGSWVDSDPGVNDRGFAWARIDVPGTNDLYVVSVHLKASNSGSDIARRTAQANEIKALISTNFPGNAWIVVAGDFNIYDEGEGAVATLATFTRDTPVPVDQNDNNNTNAGRNRRYDRVLMSFSLTNAHTPVVMPSRTYTGGLVFDSRVYTNLADVPPVTFGDSGANQMQHMAVVRDFRITLPAATPALPPVLTNLTFNAGHFQFLVTGSTGSNYIVQATTNPAAANWISLRTNAAPFIYVETNAPGAERRFYRGLVAP